MNDRQQRRETPPPSKPGIIKIAGKEYKTVALRLSEFREHHPEWTIETIIVRNDDKCVVVKAVILNDEGRQVASGHSEEKREGAAITSVMENAETSAVGRALAFCGYGSSDTIASAEEMFAAFQASRNSGGTHITQRQWKELKRDWLMASKVDRSDRDAVLSSFVSWVESTLGDDSMPVPNDYRQWTNSLYLRCRSKLDDELRRMTAEAAK